MSSTTSIEKLVRSALGLWVAERDWSTEPTVTYDAPEPGDKHPLPTLACWFDRVDVRNPSVLEVAPGVFKTGEAEAQVTFFFRATSEADADSFRNEWRDLVWTAAIDASPTGLAPVLPFTIDVAGKSFGCKLYLEGSLELAPSGETQARSLWLVRAFGRVVFPALAVREPTALMTCSVVINGTEYQSATFRAPTVLSTEPAAAGTIDQDEAVELTFDRPVSLATLEEALPGYDVTPSDDLMTFAILPSFGLWGLGLNTLTISTVVRSVAGTPLASTYTLSFTGAAP